MAQIQDHSTHDVKTKPPPRTSCFLGCCGFSGKVLSEKKSANDDMDKTGGLKRTRGFSWSRFRAKKLAAKTVPVDTTTVTEKVNRSTKESPAAKTVKKINSKGQNQIPAGAPNPSQIPATLPNQTISEKPPKTRFQTNQNNHLESREILEQVLNSPKDNTGQSRPSFCRKTGVKRTRVSHPSSPENKFQLGRPTTSLSHSVSFPPPKSKKQALNTTQNGRSRVNSDLTDHRQSNPLARKFDPLIGISIIMATLIIMLVWGRLCAILCTSAWFYIVVPRFRETIGSNSIDKNGPSYVDPDLSSEELKKKVVLEGFLERNHRSSSVIL